MKFLDWVKNHIVASVAIVVFPVTLLICGGVMLKSKLDYDDYEVEYEITTLNTKANSPVNPSEVIVDETFTSKHQNKLDVKAENFKLPEEKKDSALKELTGEYTSYVTALTDAKYEVGFDVNFSENSYCDLTITFSTGYVKEGAITTTENLLDFVAIKINGYEIAGEVKLEAPEEGEELNWTTVAIKGIALPKGTNTVVVTPLADTEKGYMPNIRNAVIYSDVNVTL